MHRIGSLDSLQWLTTSFCDRWIVAVGAFGKEVLCTLDTSGVRTESTPFAQQLVALGAINSWVASHFGSLGTLG